MPQDPLLLLPAYHLHLRHPCLHPPRALHALPKGGGERETERVGDMAGGGWVGEKGSQGVKGSQGPPYERHCHEFSKVSDLVYLLYIDI